MITYFARFWHEKSETSLEKGELPLSDSVVADMGFLQQLVISSLQF